jgi:hypothetical protein
MAGAAYVWLIGQLAQAIPRWHISSAVAALGGLRERIHATAGMNRPSWVAQIGRAAAV